MKTINYTSDDNSLKIRLEIKRVRPQVYYRGLGKSWPITTQCLMFVNEKFIICGEATKHNLDADNAKLGAMLSLKKALVKMNIKYIRKEIWKSFHLIEWN